HDRPDRGCGLHCRTGDHHQGRVVLSPRADLGARALGPTFGLTGKIYCFASAEPVGLALAFAALVGAGLGASGGPAAPHGSAFCCSGMLPSERWYASAAALSACFCEFVFSLSSSPYRGTCVCCAMAGAARNVIRIRARTARIGLLQQICRRIAQTGVMSEM